MRSGEELVVGVSHTQATTIGVATVSTLQFEVRCHRSVSCDEAYIFGVMMQTHEVSTCSSLGIYLIGMAPVLAYVSLYLVFAWKLGIVMGVVFFGGMVAARAYFLGWGFWAGRGLRRFATTQEETNISCILWVIGVLVQAIAVILISAVVVFGAWFAIVVH